MQETENLIKKLEKKTEVDSVFLTGSFGVSEKLRKAESSDIDIVVVLNKNSVGIKSVYQIIDGLFADIFFFDQEDVRKIITSKIVNGNAVSGILASWLQKARIFFDKSGLTTTAKEHAERIALVVSEKESRDTLQKISYNFIQNRRYYSASNTLYHEALEVRMLYSVVELITGFLTLRGESWRGEKHAIHFMKTEGPDFYNAFLAYKKSSNLNEKMRAYEAMVKVIRKTNTLFDYRQPICVSKQEETPLNEEKLLQYWKKLIA